MNLFVISTPSQAFFLSKTPQYIDKSSILLITKNKVGDKEKILYYLQKYPWRKIITLDVIGIDKIEKYYKIFFFSIYVKFLFGIKFRNIKNCFIGSYHNLFHLGLAGMLEKKARIYLLYDGLQMLTVANARIENSSHVRLQTKIFNLAGLRSPVLDSITFISPVNFKISCRDKMVLIKPEPYNYPKLKENSIYFVGQPLVDGGIVSFEVYMSRLIQLKDKFKDSKIIYVPHPGESREMLRKIELHLETQKFDLIFEQIYISSNFFPGTVISFYSSVLINFCYLKAETELYYIEILPSEILKTKVVTNISRIYSFFKEVKNEKFKMLDLP